MELRALRQASIDEMLHGGITTAGDLTPHGDGRGERLTACRQFEAEDIILVERPMALMQTLTNEDSVLVCTHCHVWAGTVASQLERRISRKLPGLPRAQDIGMELDNWTDDEAVILIPLVQLSFMAPGLGAHGAVCFP